MRKDVKLYNVLFPIWMLLIFPITWLIILPGNFIVDTIVLLITLKIIKPKDIKDIYKKSIFRVWILGFLSDFVCGAILLLGTNITGNWWYAHIAEPISTNPFNNFYSFIYVLIALVIAGLLIYFFNYKISFKNTGLPRETIKKIALALAIFTAPWVVLIPSNLIYKHTMSDHSFNEKGTEVNYTIVQMNNFDRGDISEFS